MATATPVSSSWSVALDGVAGHLVRVEVDLKPGLPGTTIVGLPDPAVVEARDRIRSAVLNSGLGWPLRRITVSLTPASLRKHGSGFDLALAVGVLAGDGRVARSALADTVFLAELGLDGRLRGVSGILPAVMAAVRGGLRTVVVAPANRREAAAVPGARVVAPEALAEVVAFLAGRWRPPATDAAHHAPDRTPSSSPDLGTAPDSRTDLHDVAGQEQARHATEVAAAGGHHLLLTGPPGAGKTMLGRRLGALLPDLEDDESLEVTSVHSVAGLLSAGSLIRRPPLQDPHHTATVASMIGGGTGDVRPGAVSLAHRGVLLLDEAPEFPRAVLQALRQPVETGQVLVTRAMHRVRFPARFQMVMTANPCPCASPAGDQHCRCPPPVRRRYRSRLAGPLLDRVDLRVEVHPLTRATLLDPARGWEGTDIVRERVTSARGAARERWRQHGFRCNAEVPGEVLRSPHWLSRRSLRPVAAAMDAGLISARGVDRVLRVAWTLADLAAADAPDETLLDRALTLRGQGVR